MKIFLLGFMGAGKSTFGKKLAAAMKFNFSDLDGEVVSVIGSIKEYINLKGESEFRERESESLKSTPWPENTIIATGGGTPCFFDNMEWMKKNGITVYMNVPERVLQQRLSASPGGRPMLQNKSGEELRAHISSILAERKPFYEKSEIILNWEDLSVDKVKEVIEQRLKKGV